MNDFDWSLCHSGRLGMEWGKRNGPPYPLDYRQLSSAQKKEVRSGEFKTVNGERQAASKFKTGKKLQKLERRYYSKNPFLKANKQKAYDKAKSIIGENEDLVKRAGELRKELDRPTRTKDDIRAIDFARSRLNDSVTSITTDRNTKLFINKIIDEQGDDLLLKDAGKKLNRSSQTGNKDLDEYMDFVFSQQEEVTATKDHETNKRMLQSLNDRTESNQKKAENWNKIDPKLQKSWEKVEKDITNKSMDWYSGEYKTDNAKKAAKQYEKERKAGNYSKASEALAKAALKDLGIKATQENIDWLVDNQLIETD